MASSNHRGTDAGWCGFVQIYFGMIEKKWKKSENVSAVRKKSYICNK